MPSSKFALEAGGPKRLEVSWSGIWKNILITLDGEEVGVIPTRADLKAGQSFTLPDKTTLHVQLAESFGNAELRVTRNGHPLPGSAADPAERVKAAGYILYFIAGLNGLLGTIAMVFDVATLQELGIGWTSMIAAALYAVLGYFTLKKSKPALIIGIALFILDAVLSLALGMSQGAGKGTPPVGMIFMRVILVSAMVRAVPAIDQLKKPSEEDVKKVFD